MAEAQEALVRQYGKDASYRSPAQQQAIEAIISDTDEVIAVLATGEGKSLLYELPARLSRAGTTIVIVPFVALKQDTIDRCRRRGLTPALWDAADPPPAPGTPLVIVSLDAAVQTPFRAYATNLARENGLARIVLDECHLICTAKTYRPRMHEVVELRELQTQFVFMTATLPPSMQSEFSDSVLLQRPTWIRSVTVREDIAYGVIQLTRDWKQDLATYVHHLTQALGTPLKPRDRRLVFARTKSDAETAAKLLRCGVYHSTAGTDDEKAATLSKWLAGDGLDLLVATSALAGLDYPAIRLVIHLGPPLGDAVDFAQDVGRAGRDGQPAHSVVLLLPGWSPRMAAETTLLTVEGLAMDEFLQTANCRLQPLGEYLDGIAATCDTTNPRCDNCRRSATAVMPTEPSPVRHDAAALALIEHRRQAQRNLEAICSLWKIINKACVLCRFVRQEHVQHLLNQCPISKEHGILLSKNSAMKRRPSGSRRGWLVSKTACWRCYQSIAVCPIRDDGVQSACAYPDIVLPLCWIAYTNGRTGKWADLFTSLPAVGGLDATKGSLEDFFWFLGQSVQLYGKGGTLLALVAQEAMFRLFEDGCWGK
jgi:superfamily II DNA helicase RecQ